MEVWQGEMKFLMASDMYPPAGAQRCHRPKA